MYIRGEGRLTRGTSAAWKSFLLHLEHCPSQLTLVYICPCPVPSVIFVSAADHGVKDSARIGALGVNTRMPARWQCTPSECFEVAGDDLLSNSGEVKKDTSA